MKRVLLLVLAVLLAWAWQERQALADFLGFCRPIQPRSTARAGSSWASTRPIVAAT
ncbi:hypothetical protein PspTeo4_43824 [Pseudomonas sp. Teo4]|nr:hypothetical protein [Pseudomonas sp. Teo4]